MKKVRIILSMVALVLAMGGALATEVLFNPNPHDGYMFIPETEEDPAVCLFVDEICDDGIFVCKITSTSPDLREWTSSTSCGAVKYRSTQPPVTP